MPLHVINHPLVRHKLGLMRRASTPTAEFRMLAREIARMLTYEATKNLATAPATVQGWAGPVEVECLSGKMVTLAPILRAGMGLMEGALDMMPGAKISVVGLYRDEETLQPVEYFVRLAADISQRFAIILDPMLATGGSMVAAIDYLKKQGCRRMCALTLVTAPEGAAAVNSAHPEVDIFTASLDQGLDDKSYILPGLGDAGDRLFGT
ncbi:uracil phosphoribosyltransferase [Deltaproteobacteria bacterium OttesenSCG-928-K17]|nr:uracil phosphoribosyltransferase [Deltaproteobacteria bacterium OttesenSCG-928-K17]